MLGLGSACGSPLLEFFNPKRGEDLELLVIDWAVWDRDTAKRIP